MPTDDEVLVHDHDGAGAPRRRRGQKAWIGGGVTAAVVVVTAGLVSAMGGQPEGGASDAPPSTVARTASTETTIDEERPATTSTAPPATTQPPPPPTEPPPTEPPTTSTTSTTAAQVPTSTSHQVTVDGMTLDVTLARVDARPNEVVLTARVRTGHGSAPYGWVSWTDQDGEEWGTWADLGHTEVECDPLYEDPPEPLDPDPRAGAVDETFQVRHAYPTAAAVEIHLWAAVSFCTTDHVETEVVTLALPAPV